MPDGAEFYLADAQQSPLAVVSKAASVLSRTALHPFGHVRFQTGKTGEPWGFVGNEEDRGSGISDFHARPYRAELGAFLAVDPLAVLSPEKTIGSAARLFAYAYAASDPITQSDPNGLTFGDFARGMWDQGVENAKNAAKGAYAAAKSTAAQALRGDVAGAGIRVVKGVADGLDGTIENVANFGGDFAKAVTAPSDYEAGRLAVKPVATAMGASALLLGPRVGSGKSENASNPPGTIAKSGPHAQSPQAGQFLNRKLSALEKAQEGAARVRELPDGRVRYYSPEKAAQRAGPTRGASLATEYNPQTGQVRAWMESYGHDGQVIRVHPKMNNGEVLSLPHCPPTGKELGK